MLFLSLVFLALALVGLFKGKLMYKIGIEVAENEIKKVNEKDFKPSGEFLGKVFGYLFFCITYLITYIIYLNKAIAIDPLKYPTIIMIVTLLITIILAFTKNKNKLDLKIEENVVKYRTKVYKKRTFKGFVASLVSVAYFGYILYFLVF